MIRRADVYLRNDKFFVSTAVETESGPIIGEGPISVVPASDLTGLEDAVRRALAASRSGVPEPDSWLGLNDSLCAAAGVKTWSAFAKGMWSIGVEQSDHMIVLVAWGKPDSKGNQKPLEAANRTLPADTPNLGAEIVATIEAIRSGASTKH
jgi:hypothetical protein